MNEDLQQAVNTENGDIPKSAPVMEPVDIAVLRTLNQQKEQQYLQMGMLVEAMFQLQGQMSEIDKRKEANAEEMQKKYGLPAGQLWRVTETGQIVSVAPPQR